jgi:hypothetical protein
MKEVTTRRGLALIGLGALLAAVAGGTLSVSAPANAAAKKGRKALPETQPKRPPNR